MHGQFLSPGLFIKGDVMYVADHGNNRILKLATTFISLVRQDQIRESSMGHGIWWSTQRIHVD